MMEDKSAILIASQEFQKESRHSIEPQIRKEDIPIVLLPGKPPKEENKNCERRQRLVELRWVQAHAQGDARNFMREIAGKDHSPGGCGGLAIIAARAEASQPAHALAQRDGRCKDVGQFPE